VKARGPFISLTLRGDGDKMHILKTGWRVKNLFSSGKTAKEQITIFY
jgi:hypothetical protein